MKRFMTLAIVLFLAFVSFIGCGEKKEEKKEQDQIPLIKIGHVNQDHHLALYVAAMKGELFKESGVWLKEVRAKEMYEFWSHDNHIADFQFVITKGGSDMTNNMLAGLFDIGFGGIPAVMDVVDKDKEVKILVPLQCEGAQLVVALDNPSKNWFDFVEWVKIFNGQVKMGYKAPNAVQYVIATKALDEAGITQTEDATNIDAKVLWINQKGEENMVPNLKSKQIDAFVANQPTPAKAEVAGVGKQIEELANLPPQGMWKNNPCCMVGAKTTFIENNRSVLKDFLKLVIIATDWINQNKLEAQTIAESFIGTKTGVEEKSIPTIKFSNNPDDNWRNGLRIWSKIMNEQGKYKGKLKDISDDRVIDIVTDLSIYEEAVKELGK